MDCTEVNEKGNFDTWEIEKINELKLSDFNDTIGNCLFENSNLKLWDVTLYPKERMSFKKCKSNYSSTCLTDGLAIARNANGKINLLRFNQGDTIHLHYREKEIIGDFENIGENILKFVVIEHKSVQTTSLSNLKSFI